MMNGNMDNDGLQYMGDDYYFVFKTGMDYAKYYKSGDYDSVTIDIKGNYIDVEKIQTLLAIIEFSNNSFKGEIPKVIGKPGSLKGLNFSHNNLMGHIPKSFGNLTNLEWLDLSSNKLIGNIPIQLTYFTSLAILNLSKNHLVGLIPQGKQFNTFTNVSYSGN